MTTPEPLDALHYAAAIYQGSGPGPEVDSLARVAQAQQLARIADAVAELVGAARLALAPAAAPVVYEPACRIDLSAHEVGAPCPGCGHTGYAHRPMNADPHCAMCLALGRPKQDDPPEPVGTGRAWAATMLTGICHLPPFDDLSTDGPHGCSSCGHPAEQHRAGRACSGCLEGVDGAASPARPLDGAVLDDPPDPAGEWLRENASNVIAALRAHAGTIEDEAARGQYGGPRSTEQAFTLAEEQRARAIRVRKLTT